MATLLDGKLVSSKILSTLQEKITLLNAPIGLAVIQIGNDPASSIYVNHKIKICQQLGYHSFPFHLNETVTQEEVTTLIEQLNHNSTIHGILLQLPLPAHLNVEPLLQTISAKKDVDCFHYENIGALFSGNTTFTPCTPQGIITLLNYYQLPITGQEVVVVGRSNIVGKPLATLLTQENATVTLCHRQTTNLIEHTQRADILISCAGVPHLIEAKHVKKNAIVIDVGIHRLHNSKKLIGDVHFDEVAPHVSYITPVPGGVGPMTIASLMQNCYDAYQHQIK